jgi:uroporphyrinogen-III synthase
MAVTQLSALTSPHGSSSTDDVPALAGFTVAVTASRRRKELGSLLERRGARVVYAPAIRIIPLEDDAELLAVTRRCIASPPDIVIATTGIGFRGWVEAAEGWGLAEQLVGALAGARLLARGPKARGALRAVGLQEEWSPESESSSEVLAHLLEGDVEHRRIVVQIHGEPLADFSETLRLAGAEVIEAPVYRWAAPDDSAPLQRLIEMIASRSIECVTLTSAPAAASLLKCADELGLLGAVIDAFSADVLAACVGPITAGPLERYGIASTMPDRARLGALARVVITELPCRRPMLPAAGHWLQVRGHAAVVDGVVMPLAPGSIAILRALTERPGVVLPRGALRQLLPGGDESDDHAVEMAIARLRSGLDSPRIVQTVVKRGYRLAYEPERLVAADVGTEHR